MRTFEERHADWIDGKLTGPELEAFERELASRPDDSLEKEAVVSIGKLLRAHSAPPRMSNPDFFQYQLMARIEAEQPPGREATPRKPAFRWPMVHLAWGGVCSLLLAFIGFQSLVRNPAQVALKEGPGAHLEDLAYAPTPAPVVAESGINAHVVTVSSPDPNISATPVESKSDKVTVIWVDGLDYLPATYHPQ